MSLLYVCWPRHSTSVLFLDMFAGHLSFHIFLCLVISAGHLSFTIFLCLDMSAGDLSNSTSFYVFICLLAIYHSTSVFVSGYVCSPISNPHLFYAVLWNRNYLLRFRFRFWLLKSYGSGSGTNFWKVMVPVPVPVPTFEKFTVLVPVPAPYLDHKKQIFQKKSWKFFWLFT